MTQAQSMSVPDHSPEGFYVYASSYKHAAEVLLECGGRNLLVPTLYLLTHALELALRTTRGQVFQHSKSSQNLE